MLSKRSFFNKALFRKNLTRYWPLWGGMSIAGSFIPLYMLLELSTRTSLGLAPGPNDFAELLYGAVTIFAPTFLMVYALLCAMLVWNYLYSPRAVGLMHTLPVDRTCLFVTNALSGLVMLGIPFLVVGGLLCLLALAFGFFNLLAAVNTVAAVILLAVLFFGLATLCAMLTGHTAMLPALYLLLNFLAALLETMVGFLNQTFLMGIPLQSMQLQFLTPLLQIYENFTMGYLDMEPASAASQESAVYLQGLGTVALYGLAGIGLLALSWLLYRKRQSERAGDIVAYRPLRPVFRYGVALLSALTLGPLLESAFWAAIYADIPSSNLLPMIVCMAIAGVVGYYVASMLLEKSLRVFKGSWKGVLAVCAGAAVICLTVSMDLFGLENKIPALDEIQKVTLNGFTCMTFETDTAEGRQLTEQTLDIHRSILADKDYIYSMDRSKYGYRDTQYDEKWTYSSVWITYYLTDGSTLERGYTLPVFESRLQNADTFDGKLYQMAHSEEAMLQQLGVPEDSVPQIDVYIQGAEYGLSGNADHLMDALRQDAREGNLRTSVFPYWEGEATDDFYDVRLHISFLAKRDDGSYTGSAESVTLCSTMTHTIDALVAEGYLTQEQMTSIQDGDYAFIADLEE